MEELIELRKKLDIIDKELAGLFEKRMEIIEKVRICKLKNNLPILDSNREKSMKENNNLYIKDKKFVPYYEEYLKTITTLSKKYMQDINNKN